MKLFGKILLGIVAFFMILGFIGSCMEDVDGVTGSTIPQKEVQPQTHNEVYVKKEVKPKTYTEVSISTLLDAADANAAKAKQDYNGKNLKIVGGVVRNIDSDSSYFTVEDPDHLIRLMHVTVEPRNDEAKKEFVNLVKKEPITVYCTVYNVGDIMGYRVKLDRFEQ